MKFNRSTIINIIFFAFIIFLFTPFGVGTRAKLTQGIAYIETFLFSPDAEPSNKRLEIIDKDFSLVAITNAEDVNLNELEGKVIFINYWATWCPPCRAEMPMIKELYEDYKDKMVFIFITSDDKLKVEKFYNKNNYNFPTYNMHANPPREIDTKSIPATFIIDKKGKVALEEYGASNWNSNSTRKLLNVLINE